MPAKNEDLHGMVPDKAEVALILLDVINAMDFEGAELLLEPAMEAAPRIAALKERAKAAAIPVVYVNDNFGRWRSDFRNLITHCMNPELPGHELVRMLLPDDDDYFILKPKHSGFFSTTLDVLLNYLGVKTLIITGFAGDICVLFTANDAYMRDFHLVVPCDCVASNDPDDNRRAVKQMRDVLKADVTPSTELDLQALKRKARETVEEHPESDAISFASRGREVQGGSGS